MKLVSTLSFWLIILFCGCNTRESSLFCDNHNIVHPQQIDTINGNAIIKGDSLPGAVGIIVTPMQFVLIHDDTPFLFSAFSHDGKFLLSFGAKGHSSSEILTNDLIKQYTSDGYLVVNDVNSRKFKYIDLENTIKNQQIHIAKVENAAAASLAAWHCGENDNIMIQQLSDNFVLLRTGKNYKTKMELYAPHSPSFPIYQTRLCADSKGENIAMPMIYMNQINFYSFKDKKKKSVSVYENATTSNEKDLHTYYCSACTDGALVYAIYMNQNNSEAYCIPKNTEIHVFDFYGNLKKVLICFQYIFDIDCDMDNNLYGLDLDGNVYKYAM